MNEEGDGNQCLFFYIESRLLSGSFTAEAIFLPCHGGFSRGRKNLVRLLVSSSVINDCSVFC